MFLLPWATGGRNDKVQPERAISPPTLWPQLSNSQGSLLNRMKRKRGSDDDFAQQLRPVKRQTEHLSHINIPLKMNEVSVAPDICQSASENKGTEQSQNDAEDRTDRMDWHDAHRKNPSSFNQHEGTAPISQSTESSKALNPTSKAVQPSSTTLQDTIEAQFSLEILLKHRELRLIDQEIAKCQVALEQLRRCQVIPYPAMSSSWEEMQAVAGGEGRTLENSAPNAPPWGVTSGPYTRHYRQWLIPDSTFGDRIIEDPPLPQPMTHSERSVRASTAGKSSLMNQSRSQRGGGSARLKALPHGYSEPKDDKGPMIVKRSTDGQMVKLVCLDCRRSDFNSAQGFINHCRIAHSRNFQSHDAAAVACGEEVELDQAGGVVGESSTSGSASAGLVHPLIRSAHVATSAAPTPPMTFTRRDVSNTGSDTPNRLTLGAAPGGGAFDQNTGFGDPLTPKIASTPLKPSPQTPHLSALLANRGRGCDLDEEVNHAKIKVDIDAAMPSDDDAEDENAGNEEVSQPLSGPASHSTRGPVRPDLHPSRAVVSPAQLERSPSVKPPKGAIRKPKKLATSPSHPSSVHLRGAGHPEDSHLALNQDTPTGDSATLSNLSPNTLEAHQAPSLVSDDDECDNTHSENSSTADIAEDLEGHYLGVDFESHDDQAMDDFEGPSSAPDAVRDSTVSNERHVSFASPLRKPRKKGSKWSQ